MTARGLLLSFSAWLQTLCGPALLSHRRRSLYHMDCLHKHMMMRVRTVPIWMQIPVHWKRALVTTASPLRTFKTHDSPVESSVENLSPDVVPRSQRDPPTPQTCKIRYTGLPGSRLKHGPEWELPLGTLLESSPRLARTILSTPGGSAEPTWNIPDNDISPGDVDHFVEVMRYPRAGTFVSLARRLDCRKLVPFIQRYKVLRLELLCDLVQVFVPPALECAPHTAVLWEGVSHKGRRVVTWDSCRRISARMTLLNKAVQAP